MSQTQAEKSASTREKLMQAALACLVEYGYARTTTTEIVKRAGVSRGAMLHHYPSRFDLIVGAIEFIAEQRLAEFRADVEQLPDTEDKIGQAIDLVWQHFSSPAFVALMELNVAARTEPELLERLMDVATRFESHLSLTTKELFGGQIADENLLQLGQLFLYYLMQGMATTNMLRDESSNASAVLLMLKQAIKVFPGG